MPTVSPATWPALPVLRVLGTTLLTLLLAPGQLWGLDNPEECTWNLFLNHFSNIGMDNANEHISNDEPLSAVSQRSVETAEETGSGLGEPGALHPHPRSPQCPEVWNNISWQVYYGFPYYLKINYTCKLEVSGCRLEGSTVCRSPGPEETRIPPVLGQRNGIRHTGSDPYPVIWTMWFSNQLRDQPAQSLE